MAGTDEALFRKSDAVVSGVGDVETGHGAWPATESAPAKLTLSLRVTGLRGDGLHELDAEMVTLDLADALTFTEGSGLTVIDGVVGDLGLGALTDDNLVEKALELVNRRAAVRLAKRIPVGAGLGGGSADAAAVLRWAGVTSHAVAAQLGSDVPFCLAGGRARVTGVGEQVDALPFEDRRFVLLLPPISVDTGAVYRAWDYLRRQEGSFSDGRQNSGNDLEEAALTVAPQLRHWRETFAGITRRRPRLAGSGSAWFVEGSPEELDLGKRSSLVLGNQRAPLVAARTTKAVLPAAGVTSS
ncbi:MAG: 4-(cytidine 5'-diphospho)-2-C-methyl-D-erythritol kinase [Acidimicrobiales bacterium]